MPLASRRRSRASYASLEACETRLLLTAAAIYPQQFVTTSVAPDADAEQAAPIQSNTVENSDVQLAAVASDFAGTWDMTGTPIVFNLKGNPTSPKVTASFGGLGFPAVTKLKGKVDGLTLNAGGTMKNLLGGIFGKIKFAFSITLTDSTHFEGTTQIFVKKTPLGPPAPITGVKL